MLVRTTTLSNNKQAWPIIGVVAVVVMLAIVGALLGAQALDAGRTQRTEAVFAVGDQVQTSFGFLTVGQVEDLNGLTSQDLNGVTHGIQNLVLDDEAQIQVWVVLMNRQNHPVNYTPAQFRLFTDKRSEPIMLTGATIQPGRLKPNMTIEAALSFVIPRNGSDLKLEFSDPGRDEPIVISLGQVDQHTADPNQHGH